MQVALWLWTEEAEAKKWQMGLERKTRQAGTRSSKDVGTALSLTTVLTLDKCMEFQFTKDTKLLGRT